MSYSKPNMHKVTPLLRNSEQSDNIYDPLVVSFGPYHCGKPELQNAENYKSKSVELFVSGSGNTWVFFKNKIMDIIDHVRSCYLEGSTSGFSNSELAEMMLKDASFLLNYIEQSIGGSDEGTIFMSIVDNLDKLSLTLTLRDLFLLENQIPYSVLILLINLRYGKPHAEQMLSKFINKTFFGDNKERKKFSMNQQPAHLLDAFRQVLVAKDEDIDGDAHLEVITEVLEAESINSNNQQPNVDGYHNDFKFRSSTNLKTKGIAFKLSNSYSLMDINFKSFCFHSLVRLPHCRITIYTKVFFSKMIAYENCLRGTAIPWVTAYVSFMKMLIQNVDDVKLLRESQIIVNQLATDEEALQVFNDLNSFAQSFDHGMLRAVRDNIQQHCNSKAQTSMAELYHKYLQSPWTAVALIAAISLFGLTATQTYYAVNPR